MQEQTKRTWILAFWLSLMSVGYGVALNVGTAGGGVGNTLSLTTLAVTGNTTLGTAGGSKTVTFGAGSAGDSPTMTITAGSGGNGIYEVKVGGTSYLQMYSGGSDATIRTPQNVPLYLGTVAGTNIRIDSTGMRLQSAAAIRGTITLGVAGNLIYNSASNQICMSTGTSSSQWATISSSTTACGN